MSCTCKAHLRTIETSITSPAQTLAVLEVSPPHQYPGHRSGGHALLLFTMTPCASLPHAHCIPDGHTLYSHNYCYGTCLRSLLFEYFLGNAQPTSLPGLAFMLLIQSYSLSSFPLQVSDIYEAEIKQKYRGGKTVQYFILLLILLEHCLGCVFFFCDVLFLQVNYLCKF